MKYTYETISQLQLKDWNYEEKERENAVLPTEPRLAPRFVKQGNIYVNPSAQNTGRARILIAGDQMCQEGVIEAKKKAAPPEDYNFDGSYRLVKDLFTSADLSIGNLETVVHPEAPYANEQLFIGQYYNRNCPPQYLDTLRSAGLDLLATANNHMLDTGMKGLYRTCELLDSFGFIHTGSFPDTDAPRYALVEVNGIRVGVLSYTFFYNFSAPEYIRPEAIRTVLNQYTREKARRDVAALRAAGAEFVICCIHWGREMVHKATEKQRQTAQELADAGVDYIAGSHAHVIQPYDILTAADGRRVPVIYSLGNLLCHFTKPAPKTSVIMDLELVRNEDGSISLHDSYIPCYVFDRFDGWKYAIVPLTNKRYQYGETNRTIWTQKRHAAGILGPKIPLCHRFDVPESKNRPSKSSKPQIVDRDLLLMEPSAVQRRFMEAYRLTDEFRRLYGEHLVDHHPNGNSVTAAAKQLESIAPRKAFPAQSCRALLADMIYTRLVLGISHRNYFLHELADKSPLERTQLRSQMKKPSQNQSRRFVDRVIRRLQKERTELLLRRGLRRSLKFFETNADSSGSKAPRSAKPFPLPSLPKDVAKEYGLHKTTALQEDFMEAYRLTDEFRRLYGEYLVDHHPTGESVTTAIKVIERVTGEENVTTESHRDLIADMVYTKLVLGFAFWEYFAYGLRDKTPLERTEFAPQRYNVSYYRKYNTNRKSIRTLNDKHLAYETFKDYYKRDILKISDESGLEPFRSFLAAHPRFIAKPLSASVGKGVQIFDRKDYDSDEEMFRALMQLYVETEKTDFLCEELIVADPDFAAIHPESINSLRIFTYYNGIEPRIVCAWLKAGRGSAVIDNGSSGGVLAAIDCSTGTVCTHARDEADHTYPTHPDTGFVFRGFQIKGWDEAVAMVKEMSMILPGVPCVGWDIALSADKGWQIIEGNAHGMFNVLQVATQKGMRREFLDAIEWEFHKDK